MVIALAVFALVVVVGGASIAIIVAAKQAQTDAAPPSEPGDFVAPVSSGGYRWRDTAESTGEFRDRVARENASHEPPR